MVATMPKWATPDRQTLLVKLYQKAGEWKVDFFTGRLIPKPHIEQLISDWKAEDKAQRAAEWRAEREAMHATNERQFPISGRFDAVARDVWHDQQPLFYEVGLGYSGLTFTPFAKVKLPSSFVALHVNLGGALRTASKHQRRKAIRYGKPLPDEIQARVHALCNVAVKHYLGF